uniref:Uncharacterized protein n=1 Tax=Arundo donax TaxID=35708 RepID=A0A0A9AHN3_ARUDO
MQLKHICCTPFKDCFPYENVCNILPEDIHKYIRHNFSSSSEDYFMDLTSSLSKQLQESVVQRNLSAVCSSMKNVFQFLCSQIPHSLKGHKQCVTYIEDSDSDSDETFPFLSVPNLDFMTCCQNPYSAMMDSITNDFINLESDLCTEFIGTSSSYDELLFQSVSRQLHCNKQFTKGDSVIDLRDLVGDYIGNSFDKLLPEKKKLILKLLMHLSNKLKVVC